MRHVRFMKGLGMVAVIVLSATVAASASAETLPALYECAKAAKVGGKYTGKYTDKDCSTEATLEEIAKGKTNEYEIEEGWGKGKVFKGKELSGSKLDITIPEDFTITCNSFTYEGEFTGEKDMSGLTMEIKGCGFASTKCYHKGATAEEKGAGDIDTTPLKGEFGYIDAARHEVGLKLSPENAAEPYIAEFECGPIDGTTLYERLSGSVIGRAEPVNVLTKTSKVVFVEESNKQVPESFEGGLENDFLGMETYSSTEGGIEPPSWSKPIHSTQTAEAETKGEELMLKA
jgi:hypothetical protein